MWLTLRATALILFVSTAVQAQTRTLAVYAGTVPGLAPEAGFSMQAELQRVLRPAGLDIVWKDIADRKAGEDFELVAVASFEGSCSTRQPAAAPMHVSLADTSISDGRILPFLRVDCTHIVQMLGAHPKSALLGRAIARVIAHELYHIVAHTTEHHDAGVAKAVFSNTDLMSPRFEFDAWSLNRMRPMPVATISSASGSIGR
jgi:hypothetical protein